MSREITDAHESECARGGGSGGGTRRRRRRREVDEEGQVRALALCSRSLSLSRQTNKISPNNKLST